MNEGMARSCVEGEEEEGGEDKEGGDCDIAEKGEEAEADAEDNKWRGQVRGGRGERGGLGLRWWR